MPFGHSTLSVNFDRNLTNFFLANKIATALEAVFVSNLFEISPFIIRLKKKQKRRLSSLLRNICTKRQPLQTALFLNAMLTIFLFFWSNMGAEVIDKIKRKTSNKKWDFKQTFNSEDTSYRSALCAN